jgi:hypothetical protein
MPTTLPLERKAARKAKTALKESVSSSGPASPQPGEYASEFNRHSLIEVKFRDRLGRACSLGEGFPTEVPTVMFGGAAPAERIGQLSRMDLDQKQVEYLLPFLHHFVETGKLPAPEPPRAIASAEPPR